MSIDKTLFMTGILGLLALLVINLLVPCPTLSQERTMHIVLSLMAAMVAASIPGLLQINLSHKSVLQIRAGGALAVLFLVYYLNPASLSSQQLEQNFGNASCQGQLPAGAYVSRSELPSSLDPENVGHLSPDDGFGRPVHFSFTYKFDQYPGIRDWTQVKPGVWIERYPDPSIFTAFRQTARLSVGNCLGTEVTRQDGSDFKVFIPDKGCGLMWARFRQGAGEWFWLGEMTDII